MSYPQQGRRLRALATFFLLLSAVLTAYCSFCRYIYLITFLQIAKKGSYLPTRSVFNCFVCIEERRAANAVLFYWFSVFAVYLLLKLSEFLTFSLFFSAGKSVAGHFCKQIYIVDVLFLIFLLKIVFLLYCAYLISIL